MTLTWGFWLTLGLSLGAVFVVFARRFEAQGGRRLLAAGLLVAALVYVGFGVAGARGAWVAVEVVGVGIYGGLAVLGLKRSPLWLAAGWALHPVWDAGSLLGVGAAFVPTWYAVACIGFDLLVAGYVAARFRKTPGTVASQEIRASGNGLNSADKNTREQWTSPPGS